MLDFSNYNLKDLKLRGVAIKPLNEMKERVEKSGFLLSEGLENKKMTHLRHTFKDGEYEIIYLEDVLGIITEE